MTTLQSIPEEAALCRAAFAGVKVGAMVWHCHHERVIEPLTETAETRIAYILSVKPIEEQALRLHLFRPTHNAAVKAAEATHNAAVEAAWATYAAAVEAAWATHNAAVEAAWATHNAAVKAAWATHNAAVKAAHQAECPDCPWDGRTIFP